MDVAKFNKNLAKMIKAATILENHHDFNPAIKAWVEVSEMTLNASKSRDLDTSFRNMLIKKTEDIIEHIKFLKRKASGDFIERDDRTFNHTQQEKANNSESDDLNLEQKSIQKREKKNKLHQSSGNSKNKAETPELKTIPPGFKEIKPKTDFKIITPHDPESVQKRLNQEIDYRVFSNKKSEQSEVNIKSKETNIELNKVNPEGKSVCFACGFADNPPNTKRCKNCGVELN